MSLEQWAWGALLFKEHLSNRNPDPYIRESNSIQSIQLLLKPSLLSNFQHPQIPRSFSLSNLRSYSLIHPIQPHHPAPLTISLFHKPSHVSPPPPPKQISQSLCYKLCCRQAKTKGCECLNVILSSESHSSQLLVWPYVLWWSSSACSSAPRKNVNVHKSNLILLQTSLICLRPVAKIQVPDGGTYLLHTQRGAVVTSTLEHPVSDIDHEPKTTWSATLEMTLSTYSSSSTPRSPTLLACTWKRYSHRFSQYNNFLNFIRD